MKKIFFAILFFFIYSMNIFPQWVLTNTYGRVYCISVSGTNIFAGIYGGGVYLSTNNGTIWTQVNNGLANLDINALVVKGNNIFAGTDIYGDSGGVYLSSNNGTSWTQVNNGLTSLDIHALVVKGDNIFAGTDGYYGGPGGVYLSTNNGTSGTAVNNGLTSSWVYSLTVSGTNLFAGTYGGAGVYLSTNDGTTWTAINNGLNSNAVWAVAVSKTNIFAGLDAVWIRPLSEFPNAIEEINYLPQRYTLSQNYPNPFNPTTTINYSLSKEGNVKLTVFNSLGSKVATIVNENKPAGNYSIQFNSSNLASGIYLYRLESGNYSAVKKFVLMK